MTTDKSRADALTPCAYADDPKACYRVRCQLGGKCVDDDMSPRQPAAAPIAENPTGIGYDTPLEELERALAAPSPADERAVFDEWWRDNSPLTWDDARELAISKVNAWKGWQGRAAYVTNPGVENKPIAWLVLDCVYLKPCFVTLDYEDISEHRPEHIVPLYARTGA